MRYFLMNKDHPMRSFEICGSGALEYTDREEVFSGYQPFHGSVEPFLVNRSAVKHRKHVQDLLEKCGGNTLSGFLSLTHGLSLNDTLWVKKPAEKVSWQDVSLYRNDFNEVMSRLAFDGGGLYGEQFSVTSPELTTDGMFDKCWKRDDTGTYLLKAGSQGARNTGREPYGEVLASQLFAPFAKGSPYSLKQYYGRTVSSCKLFSNEEYGFRSAAELGLAGRSFGSVLSYYKTYGLEEPFRRMMLLDAVTLNPDRHLGNFGMFIKNDTFLPAPEKGLPVFDYNLSFAPYADFEEPDGLRDMEKWMQKHPPVWGSSYMELAEAVATPKLKKELVEYADLELKITPDETFPQWRIDMVNQIKNTMIGKIVGRGAMGFPVLPLEKNPSEDVSLKEALQAEKQKETKAPERPSGGASFSASKRLEQADRDLKDRFFDQYEGHFEMN